MRQEKDRHTDGELTGTDGRLRLYVEAALGRGNKIVTSPSQAHYLLHVMRARAGASLLVFNGRDGEWRARIEDVTKRGCSLSCAELTQDQHETPDVWLCFAPVKKIPADYVAQKATELGVRVLAPVITSRTVARRVNTERLKANAVEAAEQSGRLSVPETREPVMLDALLREWPQSRCLVFCDEAGDARPIAEALQHAPSSKEWAVLTGPEGGFDDSERAAIRRHAFVLPVTLGPRIMRADTAALAALSVWQATLGDWR